MAVKRILHLSNFWITILFGYYFLIFLVGIYLAIYSILPSHIPVIFEQMNKQTSNFFLAVSGAIGMSLNGSSIFYTRKLYKLCFAEELNTDKKNSSYTERLGTIIYFIARPFFSVGFSLLVVLGIKSGMIITSDKQIGLGNGFIYECMFISFFIGFLSGQFVKKLEDYGSNIINNSFR